MKKNDELLQKAYKEIEATGKTNIKPMFVRSEDEALQFFGPNYKRMEVIDPGQTLQVGTGPRQSYYAKEAKLLGHVLKKVYPQKNRWEWMEPRILSQIQMLLGLLRRVWRMQ